MTHNLSHEELEKIRDLIRLLEYGIDSFGGEDDQPAIVIVKQDQAQIARLVWDIREFIS